MANIALNVDHEIVDGEVLVFNAPCACDQVDGIIVYYKMIEEKNITDAAMHFTFADSHGNSLTGLGNLFVQGAYVSVILNLTKGVAHVQNADTNKYLEERIPLVTYSETEPENPVKGQIWLKPA